MLQAVTCFVSSFFLRNENSAFFPPEYTGVTSQNIIFCNKLLTCHMSEVNGSFPDPLPDLFQKDHRKFDVKLTSYITHLMTMT
jgi:hypothetical protein